MPFERRTLTELQDGALSTIGAARIYDTTTNQVVNPALLLFDPLTIMAFVSAGLTYELYGYLDWIALQSTPWGATDAEVIQAWAAMVGLSLKPATPAAGTRLFVAPPETDIPAGTPLSRSDGFLYQTAIDVVVPSSGSALVPFVASTAGAASAIAVNDSLTIASPIPGITDPSGTVATVTAAGSDIETLDQLKARYLLRFAAPPHGGAETDYIEWALAVPGVTRAWCNPLGAGAGTVVVYSMFDGETAAAGFPQGSDGVATSEWRDTEAVGDQLVVANAIYPLRPVTALVYSVAPVPYPVVFTIRPKSLVPASVQAAVSAALDAVFLLEADPLGGDLENSLFQTAIGGVSGMPPFTLVAPTVAVVAPLGSLPVRGAVSYV